MADGDTTWNGIRWQRVGFLPVVKFVSIYVAYKGDLFWLEIPYKNKFFMIFMEDLDSYELFAGSSVLTGEFSRNLSRYIYI